MELQIPLSLIVFFLAFCYLLFTKQLKTSNPAQSKLPPQPWKLPFLGHLHHLSGSLPHHALANLAQKLGPIFHLQLGEINAIVISSPDLAQQVMKTNDLSFASRAKLLTAEIIGYNYTGIGLTPYGDYWRQMRKICIMELLSAKKVKSFESIRDQESWNVVESMANTGPVTVNLTEKIFTMMNVIAYRTVVGSRCKDQATLLRLLSELIPLSGGFDVSDLFPSFKVLHVLGTRRKLENVCHKLDKILDSIISDHRESREGGQTDQNEALIDVLLRLKDDGGLQFPLTYDNVKAVILELFGAGTDTSALTVEWAMFELLINPRVMHKVQGELRQILKRKKKIYESDMKELDYLKLVIKETLRLHPPLPFLIPRECRETCEIGEHEIPVDTKVIINLWKIGRDPDYWIDPESFTPERFSESLMDFKRANFKYIPFGAGRRSCPGITLGLANVELLLARLLYHFNWELPNKTTPDDLDRREAFGITLKRKNDLYLVPHVYDIAY